MQFKTLLITAAFMCAANFTNAQTTSLTENSSSKNIITELPSLEGDNWTFYLDAESKVYYIDFETISVNLSDIRVFNEEGSVVKKDQLWDLPVNTIYELDFNDLKPGKYMIELRSYTGKITKELSVAD